MMTTNPQTVLASISDSSTILNSLLTRKNELGEIAHQCTSEIAKIEAVLRVLYEKPTRRKNWNQEISRYFAIHKHKQKSALILEWIFRSDPQELLIPSRRRLYITALSVALMNQVKKGILKSEHLQGEKGSYYWELTA